MARIYATEENGKKHLVALECDYCDARIKPHKEIAESGWVKQGVRKGPGDNISWDLCPDCAAGRR